jgi:hypothetical protein
MIASMDLRAERWLRSVSSVSVIGVSGINIISVQAVHDELRDQLLLASNVFSKIEVEKGSH